MISFSKLLLGQEHYGDSLRYHRQTHGQTRGTRQGMGPIAVWNCTRACNLNCRHCYAEATSQPGKDELSTAEAMRLMESLAAYRVPVLLFSGGEPLMRPDLFHLMAYGRKLGLRMVISTNGTLIDRQKAQQIRDLEISYVGISLDGLRPVNDLFRGQSGAFDRAMDGFRHCREVGQKTGLRLTLSRSNAHQLPEIFDLIETHRIPRVCFYHLAYSGRGSEMRYEDLTPYEKREALDYIIEKALDFGARNIPTEILTVDNHCDGIYLYKYMKHRNPERAEEIIKMISTSGGNRSGIAIADIDWDGHVYIDQFTREMPVGNIRDKSFGEIWDGHDNLFLKKIRDRKNHLEGRCRTCDWLMQCNGNLRARALSVGSIWASDPGCYFTDKELRR